MSALAGCCGCWLWRDAADVGFGRMLREGFLSFFFLDEKEPKNQDFASLLAKATGTLAGRIPSGRCEGREPCANGAVLPPGIAPARKAVPQSALVLLAQPREVGPF